MTDIDLGERLQRLEDALAAKDAEKQKADALALVPPSPSDYVIALKEAQLENRAGKRRAADIQARAEVMLGPAGFVRSTKAAYPEPAEPAFQWWSEVVVALEALSRVELHLDRARSDAAEAQASGSIDLGTERYATEDGRKAIRQDLARIEKAMRALDAVADAESEQRQYLDQLSRYGFRRQS